MGIQPSELEKMTEHKKNLYYCFALARKNRELELQGTGHETLENAHQPTMEFPDSFVSNMHLKQIKEDFEIVE